MNITTRYITISDTDAYKKVYDLREEILRKPIGLSLKDEDLSADKEDIIVIAEQGNEIIGCLMLHPTNDAAVIKFRQMGVYKKQQGMGIGRVLMLAGEKYVTEKGYKKIVLHARVTAEGFYEKMQYRKISDVFTEVGIPHVVMEKQID